MTKNHQFHLVDPSPWPLISSFLLLNIIRFIILFFKTKNNLLLLINLILLVWISILWWRDIHRESTFQGNHTILVTIIIKYGIILFISSEILFFVRFFWRFFHNRLSPNQEIGLCWPPQRIKRFNPIHIPLINTIILLRSGITISWTHSRIINNNFFQTKKRLIITIILGIYFSTLQIFEYIESPFSISDSIYGRTFFISTGFHGIHVLIGTSFIIHSLIRLNINHFSNKHNAELEICIWYWHFVDIIWLFLYISIYWWGK